MIFESNNFQICWIFTNRCQGHKRKICPSDPRPSIPGSEQNRPNENIGRDYDQSQRNRHIDHIFFRLFDVFWTILT